jgi:hypothetical protein
MRNYFYKILIEFVSRVSGKQNYPTTRLQIGQFSLNEQFLNKFALLTIDTHGFYWK